MIEAPTSRRSSGVSALTVALVPTGMNCGVSTVPWVSASRPVRARVEPSAGAGVVTSNVCGAAHASGISGVSGGSTAAGRSHNPGMPGSVRRGGGIS